MQYKIFEENMERLEKKLARIANKCKKYGNDFHYEVMGEEYIEQQDEHGGYYTAKYIVVEAEGKAVINNWKFIASVEHTGIGNLIKSCCDDVELPERYYTSKPICEHCKSNRARKNTYIVQNTETGEFKQVGKSCLADFTGGMDAEEITRYISLFDELIQGEYIEPGSHPKPYIRTEKALKYVAETIRHFGYAKADSSTPTKIKAMEFYSADNGLLWPKKHADEIKQEMKDISFDKDSQYACEIVEKVIPWIARQDERNNYFHNLKVVCSLDYITFDKFGILASVFPAYSKAIAKEEQIKKEKAKEEQSIHVGAVGDRVTIEIAEHNVVTSWETTYGLTMLHKVIDINGNVYTWKTGNNIPDDTKRIVGTIKGHTEYNGIKQTEITRCRVK